MYQNKEARLPYKGGRAFFVPAGFTERELVLSDNKTKRIDERLTESEVSHLRAIRRASMAIRSCAEILNENTVNGASIPGVPGVYIALEIDQQMVWNTPLRLVRSG